MSSLGSPTKSPHTNTPSTLPPSPSWRSVLHPNRHLGRSVQYRRDVATTSQGRDSGGRDGGSKSQRQRVDHSTLSNTNRWSSSLIAPPGSSSHSSNSIRYRHHQRQSQDDSDLYMSLSMSSLWHPDDDLSPSSKKSILLVRNNAAAFAGGTTTTNRQHPPFLTVALLKLTDVLPLVFAQLGGSGSGGGGGGGGTGASYRNAARACAILDGVVATATTSPSNSPAQSSNRLWPSSSTRHPQQQSQQHHSPQSTSPLTFQYWMTRSPPTTSSNTSPTASALALEGEWETLVSPFLLLAAAEAMAADLEHLRTAKSSATAVTVDESTRHDQPTAVALTGLYQRVAQDFERMQDMLCEPFLRSTAESTTATSSTAASPSSLQQQHAKAAAILASAVKLLVAVINIRCQMIDLQASLFGLDSAASFASPLVTNTPTVRDDNQDEFATNGATTSLPTLSDAATAVTLFLQSMEEEASVAAAASAVTANTVDANQDHTTTEPSSTVPSSVLPLVGPIVRNMIRELQAWKYCIETVAALERCSFLETIVHLRQWQYHLPSKEPDTRLTRWMNKSFQETVSLLPIYFDRVHAFATPFYGFDTAALWQQPSQSQPQQSGSSRNMSGSNANQAHRTDWDALVSDFLRRQEKLGGPPMAVALVLNVTETANWHVERGFRMGSEADSKSDDSQVLWPAVYLRSTLHLAAMSSSVRSSPHNSGALKLSQSSILSTWSSSNTGSATGTASSPFGIGGRKRPTTASSPVSSHRKSSFGSGGTLLQQHHYSVLEYAPDTGMATSWPHSDWDLLVATTLKSGNLETSLPPNTELHDIPYVDETENSDFTADVEALMFDIPISRTSRPTSEGIGKAYGRQSTFHATAMGEWLHLVVLVKDKEDESRWHRRRNGLDDNEIQAFLIDMTAKLGAKSIFSAATRNAVLDLEVVEKRMTIPVGNGTSWAKEKQVEDFLMSLKQVFGLRPVSPYAKETNRSFIFYGNMTPRASPTRKSISNRSDRAERLRRLTSRRQVPLAESAAAFFLGPDLASAIG